jgi:hypothetical protein
MLYFDRRNVFIYSFFISSILDPDNSGVDSNSMTSQSEFSIVLDLNNIVTFFSLCVISDSPKQQQEQS